MAFEEYSVIYKRVSFEGISVDDFFAFAWKDYWSIAGAFTCEEIAAVRKEIVYKPANREILIDFILDQITPEPFVLIRLLADADNETAAAAQAIYDEIMAELPVYHLSEIIKKSDDLSSLSEEQLHALGKGYDPALRTEIHAFLLKLARYSKATSAQKQAAIISIGYISEPQHFNSVLEVFTQDASSEVIELAQSMLEAGQAVLHQ
ncbi:hypothetical protein EHF33_13615 [Deinococcus psychrotolerans]|uniref:Uncharacterized protein n=1 Tax=Deinococcus psychrotolerans TaxID=2489213 RepID=A0A3G8YE82_9DEIO|nr:hypothetical protein [Deinococcus psychrotolerans]AZI43658.1 hypothetical protein EHF33_13615 [Deinococcus psychrotolerans]